MNSHGIAVEMGPRNRRRLIRAAVGLAVVGAFAAGVLLTHSPNGPGPASPAAGSNKTGSASSASPQSVDPAQEMAITRSLVYGMTKQQVLRAVGRPTKILRDPEGFTCWQYNVNKTYPNGARSVTLNAVRVCFTYGVYNTYHLEYDGQWQGYGPPPTVTFP